MGERAKEPVRRAGLYARISQDRGGDELGVKRQMHDCQELATNRGFEVVGEYVDNDLSASSGKTRPEYDRLLADVAAGRVNVVVAWHPDRLYRRALDLEAFIATVEAAGAGVATVRAGEVDLATPTGRMVARIVGAIAQGEAEVKGDRQRRKAREMAEAGKPGGGGDRPFGYERDRMTIREAEAAEIRGAVAHVVAGASLRSVVADWNRRGVKTTRGGSWVLQTARAVLVSPRIAGLREHRGEVVGRAVWAPIISEPEHERLVAILNDPSRRTTTSNARKYLLGGGFLRCGLCGTAMVARPNDRGARRYACPKPPIAEGCGRTFQIAEPIEELVRDSLLAALDGPALEEARRVRANAADADELDLADELAGVHGRINALAAAFAEGSMPLDAYRAATRKLDARRDALRRSLAARTPVGAVLDLPDDAGGLQAWWGAASLTERRELLGLVIERVDLAPAVRGRNRFDPDRVSIVWRA
jgi:DNA invertase Pin-like site-specific DNA recombinase